MAYFDGRSSRRHRALLSVEDGIARLRGEVERDCPISELRVAERVVHGGRRIGFPDGAFLEFDDPVAGAALLRATGYRDPWVVRLQQSWRATLLALLSTALVVAGIYAYALPLLAAAISAVMPAEIERALGERTLATLDSHWLQPSQLSSARQADISARFAALARGRRDTPHATLVFRSLPAQPNAFALPSGQIVLTDQLVELVGNGDGLMGVLGHELGHLAYHHLTRRMVHDFTVAMALTAAIGDVSSAVANLSTLLLDLRYSRTAEQQADDYGMALLRASGGDLMAFAQVFEVLAQHNGDGPAPYLASHPAPAERIARIRAAALAH